MKRAMTAILLGGAALGAIAGNAPAIAQTTSDESVEAITTPLAPLYGNINPFYGNISPFYGNINPFYGNITSFWGNINPFYGNISPFYGNINPFYGNITSFWGNINPFYGNIGAFDGTTPAYGDIGRYWEQFGSFWKESAPLWDDPLRAPELGLRLNEMIARTELLWGPAVSKTTGRTFGAAVATPLFVKFGVDPNDPRTLQALSAERRAQFFLEWYDALMGYSGTDRIDHWMRTVNWTPSITQQQGSGADSIIGLLDATATGDPDIADNIIYSGGGTATVGGHGVGVASLMVAAHDRVGVMGIAPNARVVAFNPFDATNTTSFKAVKEGIITLAERGASVINMSLGVPGYTLHPDWRKLFSDSAVAAFADPEIYNATNGKVAFVLAAGNDGRVQTDHVKWDWSKNPALIIVGSADVNGNISTFSNTPGVACRLDGTVCHEQNRLMNIFMVAPGELLLLPDGQGGFVRRSGTSFAAPLVSGAITLLHDRWPWLAKHPRETVDIILRSARDLGAPGVDPVYGRGMLDVAASQSPLNFGSLKFYEVRNGVTTEKTPADMRSTGLPTTWEADGVYFHLFETIGKTHRDFAVPVSSLLVGKVGTLSGASEYFQHFIAGRMKDWILGGTGSFTDMRTLGLTPTTNGWQLAVSATSPETHLSLRGEAGSPNSSVRLSNPETGWAFSAGFGEGAMMLGNQVGFGLSSDYGRHGGVNPLVGLASGGAFAAADLPLGRKTTFSAGLTTQNLDHRSAQYRTAAEQRAYMGVDAFEAEAVTMKITHQASDALSLSASYAKVREKNGLLGVQSREVSDLRHGAVSDTATIAASLRVRGGLTVAASATAGRTRSAGDSEQGFSTAGGGVLTSAFAIATAKQGVLGASDMLRLSVSQPLHIERGELTYSSVEIIDRQTGELGTVARRFNIGRGARAYTGELLYAAPVLEQGELGFFGRADLRPADGAPVDEFVIGTRLNLRF